MTSFCLDHCRIIIIANAIQKDPKIPAFVRKPAYILRAITIEVPTRTSPQEFRALVDQALGSSNRCKSVRWVYGFCKVEARRKQPAIEKRNLQVASSVLRCLDMDDYKHLCYVAVGGELQDLTVLCIIGLQTNLIETKPARKAKGKKQCVVS